LFSCWFYPVLISFSDNDPEQQEKVIKYNDLVANAVIFHNFVDVTAILRTLKREGFIRVSAKDQNPDRQLHEC
jgi:hypothetical protein